MLIIGLGIELQKSINNYSLKLEECLFIEIGYWDS